MDLTPLMKPKSVAVVGASQRMNRSTRVIANLKTFGFAGRVFPINPRYNEILGLRCYPDLASTPEPADTVVVAIPAGGIQDVLESAAASGVRGVVILSSGFAEAGHVGQERQTALARLAAERGLLVCGPNCYGVFNLRLGAATFSADLREPLRLGSVAVVSQSGGFSHAVGEYLMHERAVGLSYIVSCGNQGGLTIEDYVEFLVADEDTRVIGLFVEGFKHPEKLRAVAQLAREHGKPIVVVKVGKSENARQAMLAHTGSLAGTPEIVDAVLRQSGIVQVTSLNEMIDTLALMSSVKRDRRPGWRVVVLSGLGGECGHVSDVADRVGVNLPPLSSSSVTTLKSFMPEFGNPRNPLDGTGAMYEDASLFPRMLDVLLHDDAIDVVAVNLRANVPKPGGTAPSRQFTKAITEALQKGTDRRVVAFSSFAGGDLDAEVIHALADAGVPFLEGSETAMQALRHAREHAEFLDTRVRGTVDRDSPSASGRTRGVVPTGHGRAARPGAHALSNNRDSPGARALSNNVLDNARAMSLLAAFGIPLAETIAAENEDQAVKAAEAIGYPVVVKIDSPDIVHKTDVGGVRVGCADAATVRQAVRAMLDEVRRRAPAARITGVLVQRMIEGGVEMILGVKTDPLFGPAVVCGFGGVFVEVLRDVAVRVPPIDSDEALAMVNELRGRSLLRGARGRPPADVRALADTLEKLATLADAHRDRLKALDLNPLLVGDEGQGVVAVDWLIELD